MTFEYIQLETDYIYNLIYHRSLLSKLMHVIIFIIEDIIIKNIYTKIIILIVIMTQIILKRIKNILKI